MRHLIPQPVVDEVLHELGELVEYQGGVPLELLLLLLLVGLLCLLAGDTATRPHLEDALELLEALGEEVLRLLPQGGGCLLVVDLLALLLRGGSQGLLPGLSPDGLLDLDGHHLLDQVPPQATIGMPDPVLT